MTTTTAPLPLVEQFQFGLDAPICLTWELTYACNLSCVHCLSSSGRRDPRELSTAECKALIDEFERMQIFYVNIGGGEPTVRPDFWELVDYATEHHVGVKFSTNGFRITPERALKIAAEMIDRVGLSALADRGVLDMSGGERARVLLARLLATRAPLLAADEPAAGLDPDAQLLVLDILRQEARRGACVVLTLHDLTLAARYCDRLVALKDGRVLAEGPPAAVLAPNCLMTIFGLDGLLVDTPHGPVAAVNRGV